MLKSLLHSWVKCMFSANRKWGSKCLLPQHSILFWVKNNSFLPSQGDLIHHSPFLFTLLVFLCLGCSFSIYTRFLIVHLSFNLSHVTSKTILEWIFSFLLLWVYFLISLFPSQLNMGIILIELKLPCWLAIVYKALCQMVHRKLFNQFMVKILEWLLVVHLFKQTNK